MDCMSEINGVTYSVLCRVNNYTVLHVTSKCFIVYS